MHRGAARILSGHFCRPQCYAGTCSLAPTAILHRASGQMRGIHAASVRRWVAPHVERPHVSNVPLSQGDAESRKHFGGPGLDYAGTDNSRSRKDPKAAVEGGAGRSGPCCCGQERCWLSKRPVQASARPSEGRLWRRLPSLVTSPGRVTLCLALPSSQGGLPHVRSSCWLSVSYSVLEITPSCVISTFTADWLPARSQCALRLPHSKM